MAWGFLANFLLSLPKRAVGVILDMVLGPVEDFEYVSRTTPLR